MTIKKFCELCGNKLIKLPHYPSKFNEMSGEVIMVVECQNNNCYAGMENNCRRLGGCQKRFFFSEYCKNCNRRMHSFCGGHF